MKKKFFLLLIIILAVYLRFSYLEKVPIGLYSDEAAFGYNAYSLLKTGKDEYGVFLPVSLKSFGDYKAALYSYYLIPFVWLFGLSEVSIRMGSALLGVGELLLIYILVKRLFTRNKYALLSAYLTAISPFALQFNRMVHENNLAVFLVSLGIVLFIFSLKSNNLIFLSMISFALSIYTYHDTRIFIPLIFIILFLIFRQYLWVKKVRVIPSLLLFAFFILPLLMQSRDALWARPKNTIIFSDIGTILSINQERGENKYFNYFTPALFHNKLFAYTRKFLENYFSHFTPDFLFFSGDYIKNYSTVNNGLLYIIEIPFLPLGLYFIFKKNFSNKWLIIAWFFIAPVAAALTRFVPSASRTLLLIVPLSIIPSIGLVCLLNSLRNSLIRIMLVLFITLSFTFNISYYLHFYYFNTPFRYAKEWHFGMKEIINSVKNIQDQYQEIWFSDKAWGYIYPLFYLQYPPEKYQPQAQLSSPDEFGFGWIESFDKYKFHKIPKYFDFSKNTLYISDIGEVPKGVKPMKKIIYPNGENAFMLFDTNEIQRQCPYCSIEFKPINEDIW